jgi:sterol desaturase/sphingolipid hydroxylase (fatty acid hydroxylase superfamily)
VGIHHLLLAMPVWLYFVVAPLFTVANLIAASSLVNALKKRTPVLQQAPPPSAKTKSVNRTLLVNYALLSGFGGTTLFFLARLHNVSWDKVTVLNTLPAVALVLLGNDVLYYAYHRLMHTDFFWNKLHYIHHESLSPGGLSDTTSSSAPCARCFRWRSCRSISRPPSSAFSCRPSSPSPTTRATRSAFR